MAYTHADRLTALDAAFLDLEDGNVHMHVGSVGIFELGPLRSPDGGLDFDRILQNASGTLHQSPRFRQRIRLTPGYGHPVWVDDERFNLLYHVRHACLPRPGGTRQLKRLAGRILSQQLDRGKPLWEMWFVEGLEEDRFAVISKVHHCMIDGIAGVDLMSALMRPDRSDAVEPPHPWLPRHAPRGAELWLRETARRASLPLAALRAGRNALRRPAEAARSLRGSIESIGEAVSVGLEPASPTPLNLEIGPHRRFDWTRFELDQVKAVRHALDGTLNDVVLAVVAGALARFLRARGTRLDGLKLRCMVPVNVRTDAQRGSLGNRVSFLMAELPVAEPDPRKRLAEVVRTTRALKQSKAVAGAELVETISDWTVTGLFTQFARLAATTRSYNLVVTNVPGPQFPVYLLGARMLEVYPLVPLFTNQALGLALFSYDGGLYVGVNADWDAMPDLHEVVEGLDAELETLVELAGEGPTPLRAGARARRTPAASGQAATRAEIG